MSMFSGNPPSRHPRARYHLAERYIERYIRQHHLKPGDTIPSVSALAQELGINGVTAQRAIRNLVQRRVLRTVQGKGTFVGDGAVRRLLWVSGVDLIHGEASPHYGRMLRAAEASCAARDRRLVPVWLPPSAPYQPVLDANGGPAAIEGYLFSGCREDHRLFQGIRGSGIPYVNLSVSHSGTSHLCIPDISQAHELAFSHFQSRGHREVRVFHLGERMRPEIGGPNLDLRFSPIDWVRASPTHSETKGYLAARKLIDERRMERALYVADDIVARGVTRAVLERAERPLDFDIVVMGTTCPKVPLGMPVTYVVYDIEEQVETALSILERQERETVTEPICTLCPFSLDLPGVGLA